MRKTQRASAATRESSTCTEKDLTIQQERDMKNSRVRWIEGLRGIACLSVYFHHFFAVFYPVTMFGNAISGASGAAVTFAQSPLSVLLNGNFWVSVFFVISGYVASMPLYNTMHEGHFYLEKLSDSLVKRYLRLTLPVFFISVITTILYKCSLFTHLDFCDCVDSPWAALWYTADIYTLKSLLYESFIKACFAGSDKYIMVLWTIKNLFYGYFLSVILTEMSYGKSGRILWVYFMTAFAFLMAGNEAALMSCFVLGNALSYISKNNGKAVPPQAGYLMCAAGLILGAYPTYFDPENFYRFLTIPFLYTDSHILWHIIGAFLLVSGLLFSKALQKLLSCRLFVKLGQISFALYLVHVPVLFTIGTGAAFWLLNRIENYDILCLVCFLVTTVLSVVLAVLFARYVEKPCGLLTGKVLGWLKKTE